MKLKMSKLCVWLLYSLIVKVIANICVAEIDHLLTKGRSLTHPIYKEFKTGDVIACAQSCIRVKSCKSFNFNDETHVCQLFEASGTPSIADENGAYSEIDIWPTQVCLVVYVITIHDILFLIIVYLILLDRLKPVSVC